MTERRRLPMLPLHALRAFEAASRLSSFKAAAAELSVTPGAISHQIKALEAHLGLSLFDRLHRALRLTRAGEQLGAVVRNAFEALEGGLASLEEEGSSAGLTVLNVTAAPSIAARWLAPRIHRFQVLHPRVELRLEAGDRLSDVVRDRGVDVALRYGAGPYDPRLQAVRIWPRGHVVAVCAPSLLQEGKLRRPADVLDHMLLRTAQPNLPADVPRTGTDPLSWAAWLAQAGVKGAVPRGPYFGGTHLALEAALAGKGLALSPFILVEEDLRAGRLVQPFEISLQDPFSYWLLYRNDRADEARIRGFVNWVREEAGAPRCRPEDLAA